MQTHDLYLRAQEPTLDQEVPGSSPGPPATFAQLRGHIAPMILRVDLRKCHRLKYDALQETTRGFNPDSNLRSEN
jgi:hypothetical protein